MMGRLGILGLALCAISSTGCVKRVHTEVIASPGYAEHIKPIFEANCVDCHGAKKKEGELDLSLGREALVNVQAKGADMNYIQPGSIELSYLWLKINDMHDRAEGEGGSMPPFGTLDPIDLQVIENWITFDAEE